MVILMCGGNIQSPIIASFVSKSHQIVQELRIGVELVDKTSESGRARLANRNERIEF
jgi:hypothetical protein